MIECDDVTGATDRLDDRGASLSKDVVLENDERAYAAWPLQAGYAIRNKDRALKERAFAEA